MPGKKIDELQLDDRLLPVPINSPLEEPRRQPTADQRHEDWYRLWMRIEDLLSDPKYNYAGDTLKGIQETIERTQRVTDGQRRAIDNIEEGGERQFRSQRQWGRRYEGR